MKLINENCHILEFPTSQDCWEHINEMFIIHSPELFEYGNSFNSGMSAVYNVFIKIRKGWVNPEFDYGKCFNYREQKWTLLLNNYIDFNKLDLLRSKVLYFQNKYNQNYNLSYTFDNSHGNGKGCLLAATFSRRLNSDVPVITMISRSSEITKRFIFDLLLIQRMGEYIYGENQTFQINIFATQMYCNTETLVMYHAYKPIKKLIEASQHSLWREALKTTLNKFLDDPGQFGSYKVFLRTARVLRPDFFKLKIPKLLAKDLVLIYDNIPYPAECISLTQRRKFKLKYLKHENL